MWINCSQINCTYVLVICTRNIRKQTHTHFVSVTFFLFWLCNLLKPAITPFTVLHILFIFLIWSNSYSIAFTYVSVIHINRHRIDRRTLRKSIVSMNTSSRVGQCATVFSISNQFNYPLNEVACLPVSTAYSQIIVYEGIYTLMGIY